MIAFAAQMHFKFSTWRIQIQYKCWIVCFQRESQKFSVDFFSSGQIVDNKKTEIKNLTLNPSCFIKTWLFGKSTFLTEEFFAARILKWNVSNEISWLAICDENWSFKEKKRNHSCHRHPQYVSRKLIGIMIGHLFQGQVDKMQKNTCLTSE